MSLLHLETVSIEKTGYKDSGKVILSETIGRFCRVDETEQTV